MNKIDVNNVSYYINEKKIINGVTFSLDEGDRLAILGHNGSGKTTLLEIMTGIVCPSKGDVLYRGEKFRSIKSKSGVVWDNILFFQWLKPKEVIAYIGSMFHKATINRPLYELLEIDRFENHLMRQLSQGERKRVAIYLAIFHDPDYLFLDEATSEIDPFVKDKIWKNALLRDSRTIMFSTHQWDEAEKYATKFMFFHKGEALNAPKGLRDMVEDSKLSKKIIVHHSVNLKGVEAFNYEYEDNNIFLISGHDDKTFDLIKQQTMNYTSLPIDLKDLFHYYAKEK